MQTTLLIFLLVVVVVVDVILGFIQRYRTEVNRLIAIKRPYPDHPKAKIITIWRIAVIAMTIAIAITIRIIAKRPITIDNICHSLERLFCFRCPIQGIGW